MKAYSKTAAFMCCLTMGNFLFAEQTAEVPAQPSSEKVNMEAQKSEKADMEASAAAAEKFLKQLDTGNYHEAWESASLTFKLKVPEKSWFQILEVSRKSLGAATSRKVAEQRPAIDPQGLPKGKYMVIFYKTSFPSKADANELVTLMQLDDGTWKVLTYLVK